MTHTPAWEEIEHTADWALHVYGADLRMLFENSAGGMLSLIDGEADPQGTPFRQIIELEAPDQETLLVDWLNELLYLIEEGMLPTEVTIRRITGQELEAEVTGGPARNLKKHIKAVTYHNLSIRRTSEGYETTLVFDV
ncbi:MAG TPA: archease [Chloroflexi bacterium]|nr:archease [Chloroflexota bacterium]